MCICDVYVWAWVCTGCCGHVEVSSALSPSLRQFLVRCIDQVADSWASGIICVCVCGFVLCMHVNVCESMCSCSCVNTQVCGCLFYLFSHYCLKAVFLAEPEASCLTRLTAGCVTIHDFYVGARNWTQSLMFAWLALFSTEVSPISSACYQVWGHSFCPNNLGLAS